MLLSWIVAQLAHSLVTVKRMGVGRVQEGVAGPRVRVCVAQRRPWVTADLQVLRPRRRPCGPPSGGRGAAPLRGFLLPSLRQPRG